MAVVLILSALTPLAECFDRWDKNPGPANDTEIHLTAWFVGVGVVLTMAKLVRRLPHLTRSYAGVDRSLQPLPVLGRGNPDRPVPTGSPPLLPLRI